MHHDGFRYSRHLEQFHAPWGQPFMDGNKLDNKNPLSGKDLASTLKE